MQRREFVQRTVGAATIATLPRMEGNALRGNINHSVCKWCYRGLTVRELAAAAQTMGIRSVELLEPEEWPVLDEFGLTCAMPFGPSVDGKNRLTDGFNEPDNHAWLIEGYRERIRQVADAGYERVICFSGNRRGMSDEAGLDNCAEGLSHIIKDAEEAGVVLCMELLNSKVDHADYQCDRTAWGVELVKRVGSDHFKLLYDIYHMQIMEGDVIRTIRENYEYIGHYHTGGNPGRNEIDDSQELNYPAIMRAIADTGFRVLWGRSLSRQGHPWYPCSRPLVSAMFDAG